MQRILAVLSLLVHSALAMRQYVEIERRPSSAHDFAGTLAFVFGLTATFLSVIIMLLFGWAFFRHTTSPRKPPSIVETARAVPAPPKPRGPLNFVFFS